MTAVIYARYSTDSQREESIEGQIRECTAYAEKNGFTVVKHYIDRAISAKTDNRPQFQQMIKDSERGIFDVIIVWKLDRFARNRYDSARYKTQLKRNGVKLVSATEVISAGPEGIILESVLEGYAEYYSADLSEKVVRGMTENALKGKFTGGAIPFGYTINADRRFENVLPQKSTRAARKRLSANSGWKIWWSIRPCSLSGTMLLWNPSSPRSWNCKTGRTPIFLSMRSSSGMRNRVSRICSMQFRRAS